MSERSPYIKQLVSSLDLSKVSRFLTLQQIRIVLPKWVKETFFLAFLEYLELEDGGQMGPALARLKSEPLQFSQRLLWLADFFQIRDLQRFLIVEIILNQLTPEFALLFLHDTLKKLRHAQKNELWDFFHTKLKSYISTNLPLVIADSRFLEFNQSCMEEIVSNFLMNVNPNHITSSLQDVLGKLVVERLQGRKLFREGQNTLSKYMSNVSRNKSKQVSWAINFNPRHSPTFHEIQPFQSTVIEQRLSHEFEVFGEFKCQIEALKEDGRIQVSLVQNVGGAAEPSQRKEQSQAPQRKSLFQERQVNFSVEKLCQNYTSIVQRQKQKKSIQLGRKKSISQLGQSRRKQTVPNKENQVTPKGLSKHSFSLDFQERLPLEVVKVKVKINDQLLATRNLLLADGKQPMIKRVTHQLLEVPSDHLSFFIHIFVSVEKDPRNQLAAKYLLNNLAGNTDLLEQLEFGSFCSLLNLQSSESSKMELLLQYSSDSNMAQIEQTVLPCLNLEQVGTEQLIKAMKNESKRALGRSVAFKQKCKYQLRQRKQHSLFLKESDCKSSAKAQPYELVLVSPREACQLPLHSPNKTVSRQLRFSDSQSLERRDLSEKIATSIVNSPCGYGGESQYRKSRQTSKQLTDSLCSPKRNFYNDLSEFNLQDHAQKKFGIFLDGGDTGGSKAGSQCAQLEKVEQNARKGLIQQPGKACEQRHQRKGTRLNIFIDLKELEEQARQISNESRKRHRVSGGLGIMESKELANQSFQNHQKRGKGNHVRSRTLK